MLLALSTLYSLLSPLSSFLSTLYSLLSTLLSLLSTLSSLLSTLYSLLSCRDRNAPSANRPASPRSGRSRAYAIVWACLLDARSALATLAFLFLVVLVLSISLFLAALAALVLLCRACTFSSRSRFPFLDSTGFENRAAAEAKPSFLKIKVFVF